jgi:hypothetical protein
VCVCVCVCVCVESENAAQAEAGAEARELHKRFINNITNTHNRALRVHPNTHFPPPASHVRIPTSLCGDTSPIYLCSLFLHLRNLSTPDKHAPFHVMPQAFQPTNR